jgi:CRP-like cAMP-binding protein
MEPYTGFPNLFLALERNCERVWKPRSTVLFRRGDKAVGMFIVFKGTVVLDFGVDGSAALASTCGSGALVGLSATLVRATYSMTATVAHDAELGFLPTEEFFSLLRKQPELCQELLKILSAKVAHVQEVTKALLHKEQLPSKLESRVV